MKLLLALAAVFLAVTFTAGTPNDAIVVGDYNLYALGQSGKFRFCNNTECDGKVFTITMDSLIEYAADDTPITDNKHSYQNFAKTDFVLYSSDLKKYPDDNGLNVSAANFVATLDEQESGKPVPIVTVVMMIFEESGFINITQANADGSSYEKEINVTEGTLKFNVEIQNWIYCTACKGRAAVGQFLQLDIDIQDKNGGGKKSNDSNSDDEVYEFSDGTVYLQSSYKIANPDDAEDFSWFTMPVGFPGTEVQGSKDIFQFRFEKQDTIEGTYYYDPIIEMSESDVVVSGSTTSPNVATTPDSGYTNVASVLCVIGCLLFNWL